MKIRAYALAGFVAAVLIGVAGIAACSHAEPTTRAEPTRAKSLVAALDTHAPAGGEHQCHHNRPSAHQDLVAWVRPAQSMFAAVAPAKHPVAFLALPTVRGPDSLAADVRQRWRGNGLGAHAGFAGILARNGRLLI